MGVVTHQVVGASTQRLTINCLLGVDVCLTNYF
jgi:hypothetical protein